MLHYKQVQGQVQVLVVQPVRQEQMVLPDLMR
jgi:hypothetical protein